MTDFIKLTPNNTIFEAIYNLKIKNKKLIAVIDINIVGLLTYKDLLFSLLKHNLSEPLKNIIKPPLKEKINSSFYNIIDKLAYNESEYIIITDKNKEFIYSIYEGLITNYKDYTIDSLLELHNIPYLFYYDVSLNIN